MGGRKRGFQHLQAERSDILCRFQENPYQAYICLYQILDKTYIKPIYAYIKFGIKPISAYIGMISLLGKSYIGMI